MSGTYLDSLNRAQRAAVEHSSGPELVIAGAGSGKTRVLTYKIVHLLEHGHKPWQILALTFTNKAAKEMRERIAGLLGEPAAAKLWMGTFHSIFARILRIHADRLGFSSNFTIYDASDAKSLIKSIIKELGLDDKKYRPNAVASEISNAKNHLIGPADYAADADIVRADRDAGMSAMSRIYAVYAERCRIAGAMDFDDLLLNTYILLRDNPDICRHYRDFFSYILVDEYQDTNFAQHKIVTMLANESGDVCVVGDDAQSIYSFRGANIRNILDLDKAFPTLTTFKLEQNYRSSRNIIGAANTLIAANTDQIAKEVFSENDEGDRIEVVECYNDYEEAYTLTARLSQLRRRLGSEAKIAILYRTNAQSRIIEEALRNRNIGYRVYGGLAFYQRKEVKDAISFFRLAVNPHDDEALRRVINVPKRGIGDTTVKKLLAAAIERNVSIFELLRSSTADAIGVNKGTWAKLMAFVSMLEAFGAAASTMTAAEAARKVFADSAIMSEYTGDNTPEFISKRENLLQLLNGVDQYTQLKIETEGPASATLADYLSTVSLLTDQDEETADDSIVLMTIHSAKGLEFDAVFVVGVEENLLPSELSLRSKNAAQEIEEERRLLYVAITRARAFCQLSYARQRGINGKTVQTSPSRFIIDIDPRYLRAVGGTKLARPHREKPTRYTFNDIVTPGVRTEAPKVAPRPRPVSFGSAPKTAAPASSEFTVHAPAELSVGGRIQHSSFGLGVIEKIDTSTSDAKIIVSFSTGDKRTMLLKFARFKILS